MRCEPGDTAQVVRNTTGHECRLHLIGGTFLQVRSLLLLPFDGPSWTYEGARITCPVTGLVCPTLATVPDDDLQPLPRQRHVAEHDQKTGADATGIPHA